METIRRRVETLSPLETLNMDEGGGIKPFINQFHFLNHPHCCSSS